MGTCERERLSFVIPIAVVCVCVVYPFWPGQSVHRRSTFTFARKTLLLPLVAHLIQFQVLTPRRCRVAKLTELEMIISNSFDRRHIYHAPKRLSEEYCHTRQNNEFNGQMAKVYNKYFCALLLAGIRLRRKGHTGL